MTERGWRRPFEGPIRIGERTLVTLLDAGEYIAALPKKEHAAPEWQAAMEALILVAEGWRSDDVCPHRGHTGVEPPPRPGV